jgi:hypothetical protein
MRGAARANLHGVEQALRGDGVDSEIEIVVFGYGYDPGICVVGFWHGRSAGGGGHLDADAWLQLLGFADTCGEEDDCEQQGDDDQEVV